MRRIARPGLAVLPLTLAAAVAAGALACGDDDAVAVGAGGSNPPPPVNAKFDYQIGGAYQLPDGVTVVSRDWFASDPAADPVYSICYVNAFQTQPNERGTNRPDEHSNWPKRLVLEKLGDDPNWGGEYLIDIRNAKKRRRAARWVGQMIAGCDNKGYEAVEYDNLDSWTRFDGTPLERKVPFGKSDALAFARLLAKRAHTRDLAVGQKNTADVTRRQSRKAGFDFAIAEECARYRECGRYRSVHGNDVISIEYRRKDFNAACRTVGDHISVVLRDRNVSRPTSPRYKYDAC
jgi:hypothetical protein